MTADHEHKDAPVLFFDSGVGGLSILAPAQKLLPHMPVVYAADRAGYPYGTKSEAEIAARVPALLGRLVERYRPRIAVIACNTASTIALSFVRAALDIPVVGTVPAIKPAALSSRTRVIGVLGTEATVRQPYVDRLAAEHGADCTVLRHGSAALVALAEAKLRGEALNPAVARDALAGLLDQPRGGGDGQRRARLHALSAGAAGAGGGGAGTRHPAARLPAWRRGDRAAHRLLERRGTLASKPRARKRRLHPHGSGCRGLATRAKVLWLDADQCPIMVYK
jgi:hypothetical protein